MDKKLKEFSGEVAKANNDVSTLKSKILSSKLLNSIVGGGQNRADYGQCSHANFSKC
jgi:hypothetical protein